MPLPSPSDVADSIGNTSGTSLGGSLAAFQAAGFPHLIADTAPLPAAITTRTGGTGDNQIGTERPITTAAALASLANALDVESMRKKLFIRWVIALINILLTAGCAGPIDIDANGAGWTLHLKSAANHAEVKSEGKDHDTHGANASL